MTDIENLRNQIGEITLEMIKLLKKRTQISKEIGIIKTNQGLGITDENREKSLRKKVLDLCNEIGLEEDLGARFLNFLLNESVKVQGPQKQTHLSIFLKAKSLEEKGKKIIHMEVGEPDFLPPLEVKNALEDVYDKGFTKYGNAKGMTKFRSELAGFVRKKFHTNTQTENILVCPGARFGVFLSITTLLNPGDEVIILEPSWPAYRDCALSAGVKVHAIKTKLKNKWEPSGSEIQSAVNSNTKMIVLNYPNNPTGKILPQPLQQEIVSIAKKNQLYVLSDEIYSQYAYGDWKSLLSYNYDKTIITQSFSKSHSMTGFRIGYAVASAEIIDKMARLQAMCLTNVSEPIQYVAMKALEADTTPNVNNVKSKLNTIIQRAKKMPLEFIEPDGAMYLFARVKKDGFDGAKFAENLLNYGLAVAPGEGFGDYKNFIRISACQDEKKLIEGMGILNKVLSDKK